MILDHLIDISHDKCLNQILYMLSKLPIYLSFKLTQPQYKELQAYARFPDYLNTWFAQTPQLEQVRVLYTSIDEDFQEHRSNLCILDETFFGQYPTSIPSLQEASAEEKEQQQEENDKVLRPVSLTVLPTDWLFEEIG